jgi:hypothetical protein
VRKRLAREFFYPAQHLIPEDGILHSHRCEDLKSFLLKEVLCEDIWFSNQHVNAGSLLKI